MYQPGTKLKIVDNSGGVWCRVIKVYKNKKYGVLGDVCLVSITRNIAHSKFRKGNLSKAIVIRSNRGSSYLKDKGKLMWYNLKWDNSRCMLVKLNVKGQELVPLGSRVKGPMSNYLRYRSGVQKLLSLSKRSL